MESNRLSFESRDPKRRAKAHAQITQCSSSVIVPGAQTGTCTSEPVFKVTLFPSWLDWLVPLACFHDKWHHLI